MEQATLTIEFLKPIKQVAFKNPMDKILNCEAGKSATCYKFLKSFQQIQITG
jgi:hypothetical protein